MSIKNHIPNSITSLNLLSGCVAVILSFYGDFKAALLAIIAAAIFDFFDGLSARTLKAYSPMGKELDSLADMISFGMAPAMILFNKLTIDAGNSNIIWLAAVLLTAVFSALRLAKFNIDTRQSENFIGLATPANALLIASGIASLDLYPGINAVIMENHYILPLCSLLLSYLLVSEIPMFSFKFKSLRFKDNPIRFLFVAIIAALGIATAVLGVNWRVWVFAIFASYIIMNLLLAATAKRK